MSIYRDCDCDFCGKVVPYVLSNSFGVYCLDGPKVRLVSVQSLLMNYRSGGK